MIIQEMKVKHMRRRRRLRRGIKLLIVLVLFSVTLVGAYFALNYQNQQNQPQGQAIGRSADYSHKTPIPVAPNTKSLTLMATGDYLMHDILIWSGYDQATDTYDYSEYTKYLEPIVARSDVALFGMEGTLAQDLYPLAGYPLFNAPNAAVEPLAKMGFNFSPTANNHSLDARLEGVVTTLDALESYGITPFGTYRGEKQDIVIEEINGIKVAFLSYSYGFNGLESQYSADQLYNYVNFLDETQMREDILKAEQEADITVVFPHWGIEYQRYQNQYQVDLAHRMVDWGADLVIGGHPHVIQPSETIVKDGEKKFIIYSVGNFISNQRLETLDNHYTEQGVLLEFAISQEEDGPTLIDDVILHPLWVYRELNTINDSYFTVFPTEKFVSGELNHLVDDVTLDRILRAHDEIVNHVNIDFNK